MEIFYNQAYSDSVYEKRRQKMSKRKQIAVDMSLPQSRGKSIDTLYRLFRNRVAKKSAERDDEVMNPTQLILAFPGLKIDTQMGVVVSRDSFVPTMRHDKEIGFSAHIESVFGTYWLYVFKKGKAYLEKA